MVQLCSCMPPHTIVRCNVTNNQALNTPVQILSAHKLTSMLLAHEYTSCLSLQLAQLLNQLSFLILFFFFSILVLVVFCVCVCVFVVVFWSAATGVDPSTEQWREISSIMKKRRLQPLFDSAYQGFTSGDTNVDAASIRLFVDDGHKVILAQSFSKNMGLYGHRVGCLSVLTDSSQEARAVNSQLKIIARPIWSNPPITGVRIVDEILGNSDLENQWRSELKGMADRIKYMRTGLREALRAVGSKHNWDHIVNQNGMFTYSGLSANCVERLAKDYSIYLTKNGRISMAGVYESNIQHLAKGIHEVTK